MRHGRKRRNRRQRPTLFLYDDNQLSENLAMGMLVIRHKVKDYSTWRPAFDRHASAQRSAGLRDPHVFRSSDDQNEVVIFFRTTDTAKAKDFVASPDLKSTAQTASEVGMSINFNHTIVYARDSKASAMFRPACSSGLCQRGWHVH